MIFIAKSNRTFIPNLRKIYLFELNGKEVCCLKQESWIKLILQTIPLINLFKFSVCSYIYYNHGIKEGYLREMYCGDGHVVGVINGKSYELIEHTGTYYGIYCNEKQVGYIKRNMLKELDEDKYKIIYSKSLETELAIIFCLLSDILWHTSDTNIYSINLEFSYQLTGRKYNKEWKPED